MSGTSRTKSDNSVISLDVVFYTLLFVCIVLGLWYILNVSSAKKSESYQGVDIDSIYPIFTPGRYDDAVFGNLKTYYEIDKYGNVHGRMRSCTERNDDVFGNREINYEPYDLKGQKEMCKILVRDPDLKGSGLSYDNCIKMPLTAFNEAMMNTYRCKKNICNVVGAPREHEKPCVKKCKQQAYTNAIFKSMNFTRRYS